MAEHTEKSKSQSSFALLNKFRNQTRRLRNVEEYMNSHTCEDSRELSAVAIMRMAEIVLSQSTSLNKGHLSNLAKPYIFESCLSSQNELHLKRVLSLLDAAEKFSSEEYDEAEQLLVSIQSQGALPIERIIYCYAQYLRERIDAKKCRIDLEREVQHVDLEEAMIYIRAAVLACEQKLPLIQISNFAAIHTILDSLESAEKIHLIDIGRKLFSYWIVMLHTISKRKNYQLKQLKITAVCTPIYDVKEAGKLLSSSAKAMNLPFEFQILYTEKNEFEKLHFEYEAGEKVAVFMDHGLTCIADSPKNVEGLMRGLKSLNPHVMVVNDMEENFSTSTFSERFRGALSHSSTVLDYLESCLEGEKHFISIIHKLYFQEIICKGVLSEDDDSFGHHRRIDFWREYFSRFGIMEMEMSEASMNEARMMIGEYPCGSSCSLSMNGNSMILCWKGVPLRFVSAWKFQQDSKTKI